LASTIPAELRRRFSISLKGATLAQLIRHAETSGFAAQPLRLELEELGELAVPCILHWDLNHFVEWGGAQVSHFSYSFMSGVRCASV